MVELGNSQFLLKINMSNQITFNDLPSDIDEWQALPLSLKGTEVVPLDYNAGKTGWIIYGKNLNKATLSLFQKQLNMSIVIVSSWKVRQYQIVRFAGVLPKKAQKIAHSLSIEIASINNIPNLALPGLILIDLDSTAMNTDLMHEMIKLYGVEDKINQTFDQKLNDENDIVRKLKKSVSVLKGAKIESFYKLKENLSFAKEFHSLIQELQKRKWNIVIFTNGFSFVVDDLKERFQLYAAYTNELSLDKKGLLTGRLKGNIIDAKYKLEVLHDLINELSIPIEQTVAIGGSLSDLLMIKTAGLGVAYRSNSKLAQKSPVMIQHADLTGLFCILSASLDNQS